MLLAVLVRGRWLFASVMLSTLVIVGAYVTLAPRVFRASSTLVVEPDGGDRQMVPFAFGRGDQNIMIELQVLRSMDLATRVADQLFDHRTGERPEVYPLLEAYSDSEQDRLRLARRLQKDVEIDQVRRDVGVVEVAYRSENPEEARVVTNLYASQYASRNLESSRLRASGLRTFVEAQLIEHQSKLDDVEQQLAEYQESENAFALDEEARRLSQQMADLQTSLDQAHVEYEMVNAQIASLDAEYAKIEPNLAARVTAAGLEREIATLQEEIAQLEFDIEQKYAKNPSLHGKEASDTALLNLIAQTEALKEQVRRKADRYVEGVMSSGGVDPEGLSNQSAIPSTLVYVSSLRRSITNKKIEAAALQARVSVLSRRIRKYERDFDRIPAQARTIAALQRDRGSSEQTYEWLIEKYEEARIAEESEFGNVKILDAAYLPTEPISPRSMYALMLGGLLGLVLAGTAVVIKELLDDSVLTPDDIRRLGLPLLGVIPRYRSTGPLPPNGIAFAAVDQPTGNFASSIQHIVTRLDALESKDCSVVLVTSPGSGEGKTTVAANIAAGLAIAGWRTLLLDANVWTPRVHEVSSVEQSPGLTGLLFGSALMKDAIHPTWINNLKVIAAGKERSNTFTLLASRDFDALMTYLRSSFDRIVIDGAGLHADGSSLGLTPLCDHLLVVVRAGSTREPELAECVAELTDLQVPSVSGVLNCFDSRLAFGSYSANREIGHYGKRDNVGPRRWFAFQKTATRAHVVTESQAARKSSEHPSDSRTLRTRTRRLHRDDIGVFGSEADGDARREQKAPDREIPKWDDGDE